MTNSRTKIDPSSRSLITGRRRPSCGCLTTLVDNSHLSLWCTQKFVLGCCYYICVTSSLPQTGYPDFIYEVAVCAVKKGFRGIYSLCVVCSAGFIMCLLRALSLFATTESVIGGICHLEDIVRRWAPKVVLAHVLLSRLRVGLYNYLIECIRKLTHKKKSSDVGRQHQNYHSRG